MNTTRRGEKLPLFNRVGVLRADRKMSRAELAQLVGVNPQTIGALERMDHYPSLDLALRICAVFGLHVESVFARTEFSPLCPPNPHPPNPHPPNPSGVRDA